jgi:hypothetical protein
MFIFAFLERLIRIKFLHLALVHRQKFLSESKLNYLCLFTFVMVRQDSVPRRPTQGFNYVLSDKTIDRKVSLTWVMISQGL